MTLYDLLATGARNHPDRMVIHAKSREYTYLQLFRMVNRVASALAADGISKGDRIALLLPNIPEFTVCYYASITLGGVCVPANPLLKPAELKYIWSDSDIKAVVTLPSLLSNAMEATKDFAVTPRMICVSDRQSVPTGIAVLEELLDVGSDKPISMPELSENDAAVCIYTSGTEGKPKGALLSHRNLIRNCAQFTQVIYFKPEDNLLCVLPLFHSFAATVCQNASIFCGCSFTMLEMFHPGRVFEAIEKYKVTIFPGVPSMYAAIAHHTPDREYELSSLQLCVSGGAPMPVALMRDVESKYGVIIIEGDGPTECSPVTSANPPNGVRKPGSIGLPLPEMEMQIWDDNDHELPDGEIGELVVRGDNVMLGYHNQPKATAEAMRHGWYHTGDLGYRDSDGYFYIVDRKKDMIIMGGINIYPREIEEVLYSHPMILAAAVIGIPHEVRGEDIVAVIQLKEGAEITSREIISYCRERLANFKVPRKVFIRSSLPHGGTGKVLKRLLKKELEMEMTLHEG